MMLSQNIHCTVSVGGKEKPTELEYNIFTSFRIVCDRLHHQVVYVQVATHLVTQPRDPLQIV